MVAGSTDSRLPNARKDKFILLAEAIGQKKLRNMHIATLPRIELENAGKMKIDIRSLDLRVINKAFSTFERGNERICKGGKSW